MTSSFLNAAGTIGRVTINERIEASRWERRVLARVFGGRVAAAAPYGNGRGAGLGSRGGDLDSHPGRGGRAVTLAGAPGRGRGQPRRMGIRTGPDVGSAEGDALQPEVQQGGLAEHLDALTAGGQPTVEHPHDVGDRSAQRNGGLIVAVAPREAVWPELDEPLRRQLRLGVSRVQVDAPGWTAQLRNTRRGPHDLRVAGHPQQLIDGVGGQLRRDGVAAWTAPLLEAGRVFARGTVASEAWADEQGGDKRTARSACSGATRCGRPGSRRAKAAAMAARMATAKKADWKPSVRATSWLAPVLAAM